MELLNEPRFMTFGEKRCGRGWYLGLDNNSGFGYLHSDGIIRESTQNRETLEYTGYFATEEEALQAKAEYENV